MKKRYKFFWIFLFFFLNVSLYSASISGRAVYKNGRPIYKLRILCTSTYSTYVTHTDARGFYRFVLSDHLHIRYYISIILPSGRKVEIGSRPIYGMHETVDIRLLVNSLKDL